MEIIATSNDAVLTYLMAIIFTVLGVILILAAVGGYMQGEKLLPTAILALGVLLTFSWKMHVITYYDAKVTDWNIVYEEGYVVEKIQGEIVTLRKINE